MTHKQVVEVIGLEQVPEEHRPVFRKVCMFDAWYDWAWAKDIALETGLKKKAVLEAGRWLAQNSHRVFAVVSPFREGVSHGVIVRRGRWTCVHRIDITPSLAREGVQVIDAHGLVEAPKGTR
jgi:hypothetical protein